MGCAQSSEDPMNIEEADNMKKANIELKHSVVYLKSLDNFLEFKSVNLERKDKSKFFILKK